MKVRIAYILLILLHGQLADAQTTRAKLLLYNVNIVNVKDGSIKKNSAIAMGGGKILAIGKYETLKKKFATSETIDGQNKYVIPGLWDMHIHLDRDDLIPDNKALLSL